MHSLKQFCMHNFGVHCVLLSFCKIRCHNSMTIGKLWRSLGQIVEGHLVFQSGHVHVQGYKHNESWRFQLEL